MTLDDALAAVVARTGIVRFRVLCADDNPDLEQRDGYRAYVLRQAAGEAEPSAAPPDPWLPLIRACDDHNPGCCSHPAAFCTRFNRDVTREDCIACLSLDKINP